MVTVLVDAGDTSQNVDSDSHDEDDMKQTIHETSNNTKQITLTPKCETKYRGIKKNKMHLHMRYIGILCVNNLDIHILYNFMNCTIVLLLFSGKTVPVHLQQIYKIVKVY